MMDIRKLARRAGREVLPVAQATVAFLSGIVALAAARKLLKEATPEAAAILLVAVSIAGAAWWIGKAIRAGRTSMAVIARELNGQVVAIGDGAQVAAYTESKTVKEKMADAASLERRVAAGLEEKEGGRNE
jgi:hypothetical protein